MQILAMGEEFLTTLDPDTWGPEIWTPSYICKQAEMTTYSATQAEVTIYSATEVLREIRQAEKFTFDDVFRRAGGRADVLRRQQKR